MKRLIVTLFATLALVACGSEDPPPEDPESSSEGAAIDPNKIQADFEATSTEPIAEMGDMTTWHPYFDSIEERSGSAVTVNLTTPGGFTDDELDDFAERAGTDILNFVGDANPNLDQIVVFVNKDDKATINRRDLPLLN